jgi:shikimate dehydrogenase
MTASRRAACLIGWPAKHSRSPKLHGYWLQRHGIDADYRAVEVSPEDFPAFLRGLAAAGYVGANVTIPHKEMALALTEPDERARKVGGANTVWLEGGRLRSTNTDVEGFIGALDASAPGWDERTKSALVLGAGGAGRAVVFGLIERGIETIRVANRTFEKAAAFRAHFGPRVVPVSWDDIAALLPTTQLLVNSTQLGMQGQPPLDIDIAPMPAAGIVSDVVYVPLQTKLLAAAEARGFATSNGLDMLLYQAVRGFELWFGIRPEVTAEQRAMLVADLTTPSASTPKPQ